MHVWRRTAIVALLTAAAVAAGCSSATPSGTAGSGATPAGAGAAGVSPAAKGAAAAWQPAAPMPERRSYFASAQLDGSVYAAGGMVGNSGRFLDVFSRFDPRANKWTILPSLPTPVRAGAGAALDGDIYVVGGQALSGDGRLVFRYRQAQRRWERVAPLPSPTFNETAVAFGGKLWVIGGWWNGDLADVWVYDPSADAWRRGPSLPQPVQTAAAVVYHGQLWLVGGRRGQAPVTDVRILAPDGRGWLPGPTLPHPMELLGAAVADNRIHAVWERTYLIYDPAAGWRFGPSPTVPRHALAVYAVGGELFAIGGCTVDLHDSQVVERLALGA
jgi:hypothetical protein